MAKSVKPKKKPGKKPLTAAQRHARLMFKVKKIATDVAYNRRGLGLIAERHNYIWKAIKEFYDNLQLHRVAEGERFALIRDAINTMYDEIPKALKTNGVNAAKSSPPDAPGSPDSASPQPPDQTQPSA